MKCEETFMVFFNDYCVKNSIKDLSVKITSRDRQGDPKTNPHAIPGNAIDFVLKKRGDYAPISEYNNLFENMLERWPYRAGIDNTTGNIHIHVDLGETGTTSIPYFFKEDNGKFQYRITKKEQIA